MAEIAKIKGYDIRDKKLADATSQSTVAATDAIEMKTTSGDQVYITRDSFVQAMASVLNSNSQSTISQLFGADANGDHAAINMSNLATVLGVPTGFQHALSTRILGNEVQEIPNSYWGGYIFLTYGDDMTWQGFFRGYGTLDKATVSYSTRTLHIKRDTEGGNLKLVQEGTGGIWGGFFIFFPWSI